MYFNTRVHAQPFDISINIHKDICMYRITYPVYRHTYTILINNLKNNDDDHDDNYDNDNDDVDADDNEDSDKDDGNEEEDHNHMVYKFH